MSQSNTQGLLSFTEMTGFLEGGEGSDHRRLGLICGWTGAKEVRLYQVNFATKAFELVEVFGSEIDKTEDSWQRLEWEILGGLADSLVSKLVPVGVSSGSSHDAKVLDLLTRRKISECLWIPVGVKGECVQLVELLDPNPEWFGAEKLAVLVSLVKRFGSGWQSEAENSQAPEVKRSQLVFDSLERGLVVLDKNLKVVEVNPAMERMLGISRALLVGKPIDEVGRRFDARVVHTLKMGLANLRIAYSLPPIETMIEAGGKQSFYEVRVFPLVEGTSVVGAVIELEDASIRKKIEGAVTRSEERLRMVLDAIKDGITLSDASGKFYIYNSEMEDLTGYSREQATRLPSFYAALHPDKANEDKFGADLEAIKPGEKRSSQVEITTKSGIKKRVFVSTSVMTHEGKRLYLTSYHDLTESQKADEELRARNLVLEQTTAELNTATAELRTARDHLEAQVQEKTEELRKMLQKVESTAKFPSEDPYPVLRTADDGTLLYANPASASLLALWQIKETEKIPDEWLEKTKHVVAGNNREMFELELSNQIISFVVVPVKAGGYVNWYGRDVTELKQIEKAKNDFISLVSHQIRTPLTSMRWYSEMLLSNKQQLSAEQQETVVTIHRSAIQLAELVNDLLNVSRIESGTMRFEPVLGNFVSMLDEVVAQISPLLQDKNLKLVWQKTPVDEFVFDSALLRQVMWNLLSNACKYSKPEGTVELRVEMNDNKLEVRISDQGIGVPEEAQKHIFEKFYRAQNAVDAQIEGTGLGLSVARMLVEKSGGSIWVESKAGQGSTFGFSIPMRYDANS